MKRRKWVIRILLGLVIVVAIAGVGFTAWAYTPPAPMEQALSALQSDDQVEVVIDDGTLTDNAYIFEPRGTQSTLATGIIFYPGGRVDARSYSPLMNALAEAGYLGVIPVMPFNLAVFAPEAADAIIAAHPEIDTWVLAGHSLGGAMAARYAHDHADTVDGLILLAAYPEDSRSLAGSTMPVLSLSGTLDGLATPDKIDATRALLPADTVYVVIEGGNHAYFGWYGEQSGDNTATITREEEQRQTREAMLTFLASLATPVAAP